MGKKEVNIIFEYHVFLLQNIALVDITPPMKMTQGFHIKIEIQGIVKP